MSGVVLICTVGGSHEPIVRAIENLRPDFVCFVCSEDDPATGKSGSYSQIEGKGKIIKKHPRDEKPELPNIPTQVELKPEAFEVVRVPTDDLDVGFKRIRAQLNALKQRYPDGRLVADYTGGTKTMTAALVTAALEDDAFELQLVTGARADLVQVRSGMEAVTMANVEQVRLARAMAPFQAAWKRFAYGEAARGFKALPAPREPSLRGKLFLWRDLSGAFEAWDRFDHATAATLLEAYRSRVGQHMVPYFNALKILADKSSEPLPQQEALRLHDLWLNAQRRAAQERYDDAVARLYRFLEWLAQWLLRIHHGIDTGDVPAERIPAGMELSRNRKGKIEASLLQSWELLGALDESTTAVFARNNQKKLLNHLEVRNSSILAHGFKPISEAEWKAFDEWVSDKVIPLFQEEAKAVKLRSFCPQLPVDLSNMD